MSETLWFGSFGIPNCAITIPIWSSSGSTPGSEVFILDNPVQGRLGPVAGGPPEGDGYVLGGEGTFPTDITCDVITLEWRRGAPRGGGYDAGTCTITLDNRSGVYSPATDDTSPTPDGLQAGIMLRVVLGGVVMFVGRVTVWEEPFEPGQTVVVGNATDRWAELNVDLPELVPPTAAGSVRTRVDQILDRANWGPDRNLTGTVGSGQLQGSGLAQSLATEMAAAVAHWTSAGRQFFAYIDGTGTFRLTAANGAENCAWDDHPSSVLPGGNPNPTFAGPHQLVRFADCYSRVKDPTYGGDRIHWIGIPYVARLDGDAVRNDVTVARTGGTAQRYEDGASQTRYGRHTWQRLDYQWTAGSEAAAWAVFQSTVLPRWAHARPIVEQLDVDLVLNQEIARVNMTAGDPNNPLNQLAQMLLATLDLGTYVSLEHSSEAGRDYRWNSRISAVSWKFGEDEARCTLTLDEALV